MSRGSPEARRASRTRAQLRKIEAEIAADEGREPRADEIIFKLAGIPHPRSNDGSRTSPPRRREERGEAEIEAEREATAAAHAKARRLWWPRPGNPDPGLLARPDQPYGELQALRPGDQRRKGLPIEVKVTRDHWRTWAEWKRDHIRTARRGYAAYPDPRQHEAVQPAA